MQLLQQPPMAGYDPLTAGAYATHLSQVNQSRAVSATEDIYNSNGLLLIRKGLPLSSETVRKLLSHKLVKPLETSVHVDDAITSQKLYEDLQQIFTRFPECRAIHASLTLDEQLLAQCHRYGQQELLVQKITVLALRMPREYEKALFCAWLSLALASYLQLPAAELEAAFLAGLVHDTGMLHLDPAIIHKGGELSSEEWRAIQSHTLIADHFLSFVPGISPLTRRAVREHHERCDGSGYPAGLFESQLCTVGQIVAMSDSLYAIRRKGRCGQTLTLGEIIPILQLNSTVHTYQVYAATVGIFRAAQLPGASQLFGPALQTCAQFLAQERQVLGRKFSALQPLLARLKHMSGQGPIQTAGLMLQRLDAIVVGSGLLNEALGRWFEHVARQLVDSAGAELAEATLMYQELAWQIKQVTRVLGLILSTPQALAAEERQMIEQTLLQLRPF